MQLLIKFRLLIATFTILILQFYPYERVEQNLGRKNVV